MRKSSKIIITSMTIACLSLSYCNSEYEYSPNYRIVNSKSNSYIAEYRNGRVYIVKDLKMAKKAKDNDIVILDKRDIENPNMCVISSNKIKDKEVRNEIIEIILEYEEKYPSNWDRSAESMRLEWYVHNFLYDLNIAPELTESVDFDNFDEHLYQKKYLNKILKI